MTSSSAATNGGQPKLHRLRDLMNANADLFSNNVFGRLFMLKPELRDNFPDDMAPIRDSFVDVLDHVLLEFPGDSGHDELIELLAQYGRDFRKYGFGDDEFDALFQALMTESSTMMGHAEWTPEVSDTVGQAMLLTTGVMRGAAHSVEGPATWQAQVVQKFRINSDRAVVRLKAIGDLPPFVAGQYLETSIPQRPNVWRDFSPAVPPNENGEIEFHVRAVADGKVSAAVVAETEPGDVWRFAQSHGRLGLTDDRPVLMVAGGSGLAPLRSLLFGLAVRVDAPKTTLFYGARFPGELYDLGALSQLAATNPWLHVVGVTEADRDPLWAGEAVDPLQWGAPVVTGVVGDVAAASGDWRGHQVLIAGPELMIDHTIAALAAKGVSADQIMHDPVHYTR